MLRRLTTTALLLSLLTQPLALHAQGARKLRVAEGTSVLIHPTRDLRSDRLRTGEAIELVVDEPVNLDGVTVIAAGAKVTGRVLKARHAAGLGQSGELDLAIDTVAAVDGTLLRLRATSINKGAPHTAAAVGLAVLINIGAAFLQGREAVVAADRRLTVFIDESRDFEVVAGTTGQSTVRALPAPFPVPLDPTAPSITDHVVCSQLDPSGAALGVADSFSVRVGSVSTRFAVQPAGEERYYEVKWYANERFVSSEPVTVRAGQGYGSATLKAPQGSTLERGDYKVLVLRNGNPESIQVFNLVP